MAKNKGKWTQEEMKQYLETNDQVLYGALKALYDCQTVDEKSDQQTKYTNKVGFNGADSKIMSSLAEFLIRRGYLTDKQKVLVRKKIAKYLRQVTNLANAQWERKAKA